MDTIEENQRAKTDHRRRRPALACVSCRKSKIRCDRQHPCGACVRSRHKTCIFEVSPRSIPRRSGIASNAADPSSSTETERRGEAGPITPASSASTTLNHDHASPLPRSQSGDSAGAILDANAFMKRIFELERRLEESTAVRKPPEKRDRPSSGLEGQTIESYLAVDIHSMSRGVFSKTRCFGQSHWMNIIVHFKSMLELFEHQSQDAKSEAVAVLNRCKALGRSIKAQRYPGIINKFGTNIPPRDVADKLVDCYLRSIETVFRVVHVPSFRRDYEQYWAAPDMVGLSFVIQLQLVMAIGATLYDDSFTMRKSAVQWVTEAQYWLLAPPAKGKLTIAGLQIMVLLTIARETACVGGDLVWIHVGSLLRSAFYMGLHRDPSRLPTMSWLDGEIRRRLWNTIIELELKTSSDSGGFPTVSLETSDTKAPADLDDIDLTNNDEGTYSHYAAGERFTDMSIALALRESFRDRLAIYQMLNATPFRGTYDDTIQLHRRFAASFKSLMKRLKSYPPSGRQPTSFQYRLVEILARRCLMSLHLPYLGAGFREPAFSFSTKEVVESAVKSYYLLFPSLATSVDPSRPLVNSGDDLEVLSTEGDDLARFAVCASGFWRLIASQSSMVVMLELQTTLQDEDSIGPPTPRPDLLNILRHSLPLYVSRIQAGETNVKGYLFAAALAGHVQCLMDGLRGPKITEPILSAAMKTEKLCFDLLKKQLESEESASASANADQIAWDSLMTANGEWADNSITGPFFDVASIESFLGPNAEFDFMSSSMPF